MKISHKKAAINVAQANVVRVARNVHRKATLSHFGKVVFAFPRIYVKTPGRMLFAHSSSYDEGLIGYKTYCMNEGVNRTSIAERIINAPGDTFCRFR